ncbi:MAG: trypsin-like serine protease [Terracidiphilus sp.]
MFKQSICATVLSSFAALSLAIGGTLQAQDVVRSAGGVTWVEVNSPHTPPDFVHATPMPLPQATMSEDAVHALLESMETAPVDLGGSGGEPGSRGTGSTTDFAPMFLGEPEGVRSDEVTPDQVTPEDWGTSDLPFTTVRADLSGLDTNTVYPYRAVGKLFFNITSTGYSWCSGSMIKPGIVVTAGHCVAQFGKKKFQSGWQFVPGYWKGAAPYGTWTVAEAYVPTAYYNGTDSCAQSGVVCEDDVAVLVLNTQKGKHLGSTVGWFGYYYGGGFTSAGLAQITQVGFPGGLDSANYMERTDSQGFTSSSNSNNHIIGSNENGGSSGGPWVENFGLASALTGETHGSFPAGNVIVGVTSWGPTSLSPKEDGASPFTSGNIKNLLATACSKFPGAC